MPVSDDFSKILRVPFVKNELLPALFHALLPVSFHASFHASFQPLFQNASEMKVSRPATAERLRRKDCGGKKNNHTQPKS
ncbi:MAG: hypothetical protein LBD35_07855 [Prevotellaceae bacterium]|jgi:hypothetical protein|nr:hypothetical protein [Prevotellaceae bacterium]